MDGLKRLERLARLAREQKLPASPPLRFDRIIAEIEARQAQNRQLTVIGVAFAAASSVAAAVFITVFHSLEESSQLIDGMYASFDPLLEMTMLAGL